MAKNAPVPKPKKDLFHYLKIVAVVLFFAFFAVACLLSYRFGVRLFTNDGLTGEDNKVTYTLRVTQGESVLKIGGDLETHGVISSRLVFFVQSKLYKCRIAPGEYQVNSAMSSKAILKYLHDEYLKAREATAQP